MHCLIRCLWGIALLAGSLVAQTPEWIWAPNPGEQETRYFRKTFLAPTNVARARLTLAADNEAEFRVNGQAAVKSTQWSSPMKSIVMTSVSPGEHTIEVKAQNAGGPAGVLVRLELLKRDGTRDLVVSDGTWQTSTDGQSGWVAATSLGKLGVEPWGDVALDPVATPAESLKTLPGFKVELVRSAEPGDGSWVSMTTDPKGRLIISPQGVEPMRRVTLDSQGKITQFETINVPVKSAMGLLCAFDALYVNGQGPEGYHLYRITDSNGDDRYDRVELLRRWKSMGREGGGGEHGAHAIVKGPDDHLYIVNGNFVDVPTDLAPSSPVRHYADDVVLPRLEDGNGFGAGRKPPGGYVLRVSPDGKNAELFSAGERNTYDIAFNRDGELFGFDSDMEWDWGTPWYRPTRIHHAVSGGDHGFREGSAKWPEYYTDSLPPVLDVGIGSPTGVLFGTGAKFPVKYQRALFAMDWSYGRILAVHLEPEGASYRGTMENFVTGKPLNVADMTIGPDGSLYFITGGRGTQSGLYRVSYTGPENTDPHDVEILVFTPEMEARAERRKLEQLHNPAKPGTVEEIWPSLGSADRSIRFAARVALEALPVATWKDRALAETNASAGLQALLALARYGTREDQSALLQTIARWPLAELSETDFLTKLRVIEVSFARHGIPEAVRPRALEKLGAQFPADSVAKNRELVQLLVALNSPEVVSKALALRDAAPTQEEQMTYQVALRLAKTGWTPELRRRYFEWFTPPSPIAATNASPGLRRTQHSPQYDHWFREVGLDPVNGASFDNFLKNIRQEAFANVPDAEKAPIASILAGIPAPAPAKKPLRMLVKEWTTADLMPTPAELARGRNFERGRETYREAQCAACHRFQGAGADGGPDLTGVGTRYSPADVLKAITEPNAVISEQYQAVTLTMKNDSTVWGRLVGETAEAIELMTDPLNRRTVKVLKVDVKDRAASPISPMPEGLLNSFKREEILDLLAYLQADGNPLAPAFKP